MGDVMSFANGKTSPERSDGLRHPVYGSNGVIGFANDTNSPENTIVIGRVGSYCGSLYLSKQKCWVTDNAIRASALDDNDGRFLFYLLSTLDLNHWRAGSGQPLLNQTILSQIPASAPPADEQRAIAHILGTLDDKIELNRRMNETLEAMARAIFKSWFVDFDPVRAKAEDRDPGLPKPIADLFPARFDNSQLGEIPTGWRVGTVDEEFNLTMGQSPPGETYNEAWEGLPFYQGRADFGFRFPSQRVFCTDPTRFAEAGDTLVSVRAPVGDINMAAERCCIGRGVAATRHKSGSRSYTYHFMHSIEEVFDSFEAEGTIFGSISKRDFHNIQRIVPPIQIVNAFDRFVAPIDDKIANNDQESRTLATLRDTLLPKLLSGEIKVKDAEKLLEKTL